MKQVRRDRKAPWARVAKPDRLGRQELRACRVKKVKLESLAHKVRRVLRDQWVSPDPKGCLVTGARLASLGLWGHPERVAR